MKYLKKTPTKDTPTSDQQYVPSNTPINATDSIGSDSIALSDSAKEEVEEQPKNEKVKEEEKVETPVDSVLDEQPQEEIYNPIY